MYASLVAKPRSKNVIWRILMATWSDRRVSLKWCMNWAEFIFRSKKYWIIYITIFCRNLIFEVNENRKAQAWSINDYNNLFWLFLWNRMHFVTAFNLLYFLNCDSYLGSCRVYNIFFSIFWRWSQLVLLHSLFSDSVLFDVHFLFFVI